MISKRLKFIVEVMKSYGVVADIGTDHGYVSAYIIQNNKAKKVIASDISAMSLQKAVDYVKQEEMYDKVETRVGDGISVLNIDEADAVVIAGMGGVLISEILESDYKQKFVQKIPTLILQPVQQARDLRYYLYENIFDIVDEHYIEDMGKNYHIIIARKCDVKSKKYESIVKNKDVVLECGILNIERKNELLKENISKKIEKNKKLLDNMTRNGVAYNHIDKVAEHLKELEEVYEAF